LERLHCVDHLTAAHGVDRGTTWLERTRETDTTLSAKDRPFAGLSYGHGWFRTSDLSRVKRYVTRRESAHSACKSG
jgi:hypothetical protein